MQEDGGFNRVQNDEDFFTESARTLGVEILGFVPQEPGVASFDMRGRFLRELPDDSIALAAIRKIVGHLG